MNEPVNPYAPPQHLPPLVAAAIVDPQESYVEYELTLDEYLAFNDFYQRKSPAARATFRKAWTLRATIWVAAGLGAAAVVYRLAPGAFATTAMIVGIVEAVWLSLYPLQHRRAIRHAVGRHYRQDNMGMLFGRRRLTLTPEYVVESTPYSQTITRWMGIVEVCVQPDAIYLFTSAVSAKIVPSRVFANEADFRRFGSLAQDTLAKAHRVPQATN